MSVLVYRGDALEVASWCRGLGGAAEEGVAERLGLVPAMGAERRVVSIEPGGMGSQVAFLGAHLVDATCYKLP